MALLPSSRRREARFGAQALPPIPTIRPPARGWFQLAAARLGGNTRPWLRRALAAMVASVVGLAAHAQTFNYAEALQKSLFFYEAQESGPLDATNRVAWRSDSALTDGSGVGHDLTGGWYDAGDHVKFGFPMAFSATALAWGGIDFADGYQDAGQLARLKRNLRFVNDYFLRCHTAPNEFWGQVGNGGTDHAWWGSAEVMQMSRPAHKIDTTHPGSDLAAETAAAMAAASMLFATDDPAYSATLRTHAIQLYTFADTYRAAYSDSITDAAGFYKSYSGYKDELVWGAIWLYRATGDIAYLNKAETYYADLGTEQQSSDKAYKWTIGWDDKSYGCYALLAKLTGKAAYKADVERHLDYWTTGYNGSHITYSPGGLAFLDTWGSLRYSANTAFLALYYQSAATTPAKATRYHDFALGQIRYILGSNPANRSFVCGFGTNPPSNPHHRTAHGTWANSQNGPPTQSRHILYGALVGGPDATDAYTDDRGNFTSNEVATDYNALFTGTLAALTSEYGGTPLAGFPLAETPVDEFVAQAKINGSGPTYTEYSVWVNNHTAWPARIPSQFKFRLFINISEGITAGYSAASYVVSANGSNVSFTTLQPWNASSGIYYTEVTFTPGTTIWPGGQGESAEEAQIRIRLPYEAPASAWSSANDWSAQGLNGTLATTTHIPLYADGVLVAGSAPTSGTPVQSVAVTPETAALGLGETAQLTATVLPANASNKAVTWSTNRPAVATVDSSTGLATGVGPGTATLTATTADGAFTDTATITVTSVNVPVTGVTVAPLSARIAIGATVTCTAAIAPANASDKSVLWTSSIPGVVSLSSSVVNGVPTCVATGAAAGTTTVTARTTDGDFRASASIEVFAVPVTGITIDPSVGSLPLGGTATLRATVSPANASNRAFTWSSSNPLVASVGATTGLVTGKAEGTATIRATSAEGSFVATRALTVAKLTLPSHTDRFTLLRNKLVDPANGYFSADGVPYHSAETLLCEAPDHGHETTSEAYSYWIWLEVMNGKITGNWSPLADAWRKMEATAIPTADMQPTTASYNPAAPATYAGEFALPDNYPAPLESSVPVGRDPVSADLTAAYGSNIYGMHWLFDCDNFYGYGNKGDGVSTPSYINTFQRGEQESVWETVPQPSWEALKWGDGNGTGFLRLFVSETGAPAAQWRYTNAPDADARAVQALYWGVQFAKEQGLAPAAVLPLAQAAKMGDFVRLAMFDKYFKPLGVQSKSAPGATGYESAHYLVGWYYAWGGPLVTQGWAWRIGCSHAHFGYQNPVAAYALSATTELRPASVNGARDWDRSLTRQLEFYQWLQSAEGAIAGGATNSFNGRYDPYPTGTPTFYGMAFQENPVYRDPGSNTWFGMQAWSMERVAEYYYISNNSQAKAVLDKWVTWARSVVDLGAHGSFAIPSEIAWTGAPVTWDPASPVANTNLHVSVVSSGQDLGIAASLAKTLTYYAAATQRYGTLDTAARDLAKEILDRMWTRYYEPAGRGVAVEESRSDYHRFFDQTVYIPAGWTGKMANGDVIEPGVKFIELRSKYLDDPDYATLEADYLANRPFKKAYHRFWAQAEIALANAEFGRFFPLSSRETYPQWQTRVFTAAEIANGAGAPLATPAGDGMSNLLKFALGCDTPHKPLPADRSPALDFAANGDVALAFTSPAAGITYIVERSTDLIQWTEAQRIDNPAALSQTILLGNKAGLPRLFGRLHVALMELSAVPCTGITLTPTNSTLGSLGETLALTAAVQPSYATNKLVTYRSSNPAVASVDATGTVVAVANGGPVTITATTQDGGFTATSTITVNTNLVHVTGVNLDPPTATLTSVGQTQPLTATVLPANATNKSVTFSSSNPAVATVGASGTVTAVADGTATITVTTQDGSRTDTTAITVDTLGAPLANVEVTFTIANSWEGGYSANIAIKNTGAPAIQGWTLKFTLPAGQTISNMWGATFTATGQQITVKNADYTATIAPGASVTVGLNVTGPTGTPAGFAVYSP